jgi:hypothetical protein
MPHAVMVADELELAITRVREAMDRVVAAWEADHPDHPLQARAPDRSAWHPDPNQAPATTRQSAEVARLRATSLRETGLQVYQQAKRLQEMTQELHALLRQPPQPPGPASFTRVGHGILSPSPARQGQ